MRKKSMATLMLVVYLSCALTLMGCGKDFLIRKDQNPTITRSEPSITRSTPIVTKEKIQSAKVVFIHQFSADGGPYKKLGLSKKYTVYSAQERMKKEGGEWRGFINIERVVLRNYGATKKSGRQIYGPGYLEPGHIFFCQLVREDVNGNRLYRARFIGQCGNEIPGDELMVLEMPVVMGEKTLITESGLVTETWVYNNVDHKWTLLAGIAGILIGLGLGYLFWFVKGATSIVAAAGAPCPPGGPGPVPPVPFIPLIY